MKVATLTLFSVLSLTSFTATVQAASVERVAPVRTVQVEDANAEFRTWCENRLRQLDRARYEAGQFSQRGDFVKSVDKLIEGLYFTSYSYGDLNPVTLNLMYYAHTMGTKLRETVGADVRGLKATAITLEAFYDLIQDTAAKIDYQFYSCRSIFRGCHYSRSQQFETNVFEMAQNILQLVNSNLLVSRGDQVFPLGPTQAYLTAVQIASSAAYTELRNLVYADAYSCEILDLDDTARDLEVFNSAPREEMDKREKFYQTYTQIEQVIYDLNSSNACGHYRY